MTMILSPITQPRPKRVSMTTRHESCPECGAQSINKHDPVGIPTLLKCECGNVWHMLRGYDEIKKKKIKDTNPL